MRLLELLTHAGGPSASAGNTIHIIHSGERDFCKTLEDKEAGKESNSDEPAKPVLVSYKLRDLMAGDANANVYVEPGDIISIPPADQVFVIGSVVRPAPIPLVGKLTLTHAIAMAGGPISGVANKKQVRVIRQEPGTDRREVKVYSLEDIEKRRIEDVTLQANDVIEVPGAKSIGRSILGLFTPTLTQLPIQVIRPY
jgi:polysaccharide export outer membrane protein